LYFSISEFWPTIQETEPLVKAVMESSRLTVYHFRGHDSLSLAVFNGIVLWGATDQTGTGYRFPLAFESDIRSIQPAFDF